MAIDAIGPYRILRKLQASGIGVLYEGVHEGPESPVLIRVVQPGYASEPGLIKRFLSEARVANVIAHPGFVPLCDDGELPDGSAYLVWEVASGETLQKRCKRLRGPLPVDLALRIGLQLAEVLAAAHARGIVHRDLQPQHILLVADGAGAGREQAKLLDFGITNFAERWHAVHAAANSDLIAITGNPIYMSPEQCSGSGIIDDKSDVYALGVILFQMLAGRPPFAAEGYGELLGQHLYKSPPALGQLVPQLPPGVAALVDSLLGKQRAKRPSMEQVVSALAPLVQRTPVGLPARSRLRSIDPLGATGRWSLSLQSSLSSSLSALRKLVTGAQPRGLRRRWPAFVGIGLALAVGGLGSWRLLSHSGPAKASPPVPLLAATPPVSASPPPLAASAPPPEPAVAAVAAPPSPPLSPPPATTTRRQVQFELTSDPSGAQVIRVEDGQLLGQTPWRFVRPAAPAMLLLRLRKPGFADAPVILDCNQDSMQEVSLTPLPPSAAVVHPLKLRSAHPAPTPTVVRSSSLPNGWRSQK